MSWVQWINTAKRTFWWCIALWNKSGHLSRQLMRLCCTFREWDGDDYAISCTHPQSVAGYDKSGDSHKWETQFTCTCNTHRRCSIQDLKKKRCDLLNCSKYHSTTVCVQKVSAEFYMYVALAFIHQLYLGIISYKWVSIKPEVCWDDLQKCWLTARQQTVCIPSILLT